MPLGALFVMAWILILVLLLKAPAGKINSALPSAEARDPPLGPIVLMVESPTGVPTVVGTAISGMEEVRALVFFLHPDKIRTIVTGSNSRSIFFISIIFLNRNL